MGPDVRIAVMTSGRSDNLQNYHAERNFVMLTTWFVYFRRGQPKLKRSHRIPRLIPSFSSYASNIFLQAGHPDDGHVLGLV